MPKVVTVTCDRCNQDCSKKYYETWTNFSLYSNHQPDVKDCTLLSLYAVVADDM